LGGASPAAALHQYHSLEPEHWRGHGAAAHTRLALGAAVTLGIFVGELLTTTLRLRGGLRALASGYLALVYTLAAWGLRRRGLDRPIGTPKSAAWFAGVTAVASGVAAAGYVVILVSGGGAEPRRSLEQRRALLDRRIQRHHRAHSGAAARSRPRRALGRHAAPPARAHAARPRSRGRKSASPLRSPRPADVRLFYPLFAPVTWIALRHGVPGAMISVSLVQAALVAALELTPGSIPLFDVQFPLLSLGVTALFLGALATQRDTTLRQMRQQDAALQRSMRFAVAGQLASALTHELNQPMTALLSYVRSAELMTEPLARAGRATRRYRAQGRRGSRSSGRRAAAAARVYRGEDARLEPTDPLSGVRRVAGALQDRMRSQRGGASSYAPRGVPTVMVDRTQLEIAMHNLLTNSLDAFDALPAKGSRGRRIEVTAEVRGADVLIGIDDSGPGCGESHRTLFEPFVTSKISGMAWAFP